MKTAHKLISLSQVMEKTKAKKIDVEKLEASKKQKAKVISGDKTVKK